MKLDSWKCDICGKLREKDSNRWFVLRQSACPGIYLGPFSEKMDGDTHLCGEDCAVQMVGRWLATGTFEAPSQRPISKPEGK